VSLIDKTLPSGVSAADVWTWPIRRLTYEKVLITFTHKAPSETLMSTPVSLPTSKPSTPQLSIEITSEMMPTSDVAPESVGYQLAVYVAGKNTDTVAQTVYVEVVLNGTTVISRSTSVSAGYYWTFSGFVSNVDVGDVVDVYMWATSSLVNWDYYAYQVQVMRVAYWSGSLVYDLAFTSAGAGLTKGSPSVASTGNLYVYTQGLVAAVSNASSGRVTNVLPIGKLIATHYGDYYINYGTIASSSTSRPYYHRQYYIYQLGVVR